MIALIDYGVGNLFSLTSSLKAIGSDVVITSNPDDIRRADKIILPGVGAFGDAIEKLRATGLDKVIIEEVTKGKKILGICLGMQLLFEKSFEYGEHTGLGLLKGEVVKMEGRLEKDMKIPHIGWNVLNKTAEHQIFKYVNSGDFVYFVHSYYVENCDDSLLATTEYSRKITAAVAKDNVTGTQFHPEKSSDVGLSILRAFVEWGEEE